MDTENPHIVKKLMNLTGKILMHPITVILAIGIGVYIGVTNHDLAEKLGAPGVIYLQLLQMCVLPIMIAAVTLSIGNLLRLKKPNSYILKVVSVFLVGMIMVSIFGILVGLLGRPGKGLGPEQKAVLGKEIAKAEAMAPATEDSSRDKNPIIFILYELVPSNIFKAITEGKSLAVLFFCLVLGIALGSLQSSSTEVALALADAVYESLLKVIAWMLYGLPFGLCCLFADQIRRIGLDLFSSMFKMMLLINFACVMLVIFYSIVIWWRSETTYLKALSAMRRAMMVALGTSSSFAAIPFALEGLNKRLRFENESVNLMIPMGITLNPHGNILCFGMTAVFMAQLYDMPMGISHLFVILLLSIMAGVAASSAPGVAALSMITLVLDPLGLPSVVGVILLAAMNPVIDPLLTLVNLYGNCATASMVAGKEAGPRHTVRFATVSMPVVDQP